MSEQMPYRRLDYDERDGKFDDYYDVLVGPDGFECMLGEPEDRTWFRDGKQVVKRLNAQHAEIERLHELVGRMPKADESDRVWMAWALKLKAAEKARKPCCA